MEYDYIFIPAEPVLLQEDLVANTLNQAANGGWRVHTFQVTHNGVAVLLQRELVGIQYA